jgi:fructose-bisphosphate aldolase class 1
VYFPTLAAPLQLARNAINRLPGPKPWKISFSYGRALQDPALEAWHGRDEYLAAGQSALYRRNSAAPGDVNSISR